MLRKILIILLILITTIQMVPYGESSSDSDTIEFRIKMILRKGENIQEKVSDYLDLPIKSFTIYADWHASPEIDVFIVDGLNYRNYVEGKSFVTLWKTTGSDGIIDFEHPYIHSHQPYVIVFDNTDYGFVKPPEDVDEHNINLIVDGYYTTYFEPQDDDWEFPDLGNVCIILSLVILPIILLVVVLAYYFAKDYEDKTRQGSQLSCPHCGSDLVFSKKLGKYYCGECNKY